jgi:Protein of unknown function (DUF2829)
MEELHNFSEALNLLKTGLKLARVNWHSKNMFIFMVAGSSFVVNREPLLSILGENTVVNYNPHIDIKLPNGSIAVWNPSQVDMFSEDWQIVH